MARLYHSFEFPCSKLTLTTTYTSFGRVHLFLDPSSRLIAIGKCDMAPSDKIIKPLIATPFGQPAYWEEDILTELCKSTPTQPLQLEEVTLVCNRRVTGLVST